MLDENPIETLFVHADGIFYHDLSASWRSGGVMLTIGVNNIADQKPPTLIDGATNTDVATYDALGRFAFQLAAKGQKSPLCN